MTGYLKDFTIDLEEKQNLTVTILDEDFRQKYRKLKDKKVTIEIKEYRGKRSKDANAFCWALCTQIGNAMHPPVPKEEVYRKAIRDVGSYFPVPVRDDLIEKWQDSWSRQGIGWFAEATDKSKNPGYTLMFSYCGSSSYDTQEMSRLLEYLVDDAEQMGLAIPMSKEEEAELLKQWGLDYQERKESEDTQNGKREEKRTR